MIRIGSNLVSENSDWIGLGCSGDDVWCLGLEWWSYDKSEQGCRGLVYCSVYGWREDGDGDIFVVLDRISLVYTSRINAYCCSQKVAYCGGFDGATIKGAAIGNYYIAAVLNRNNIRTCCCGFYSKLQQYIFF